MTKKNNLGTRPKLCAYVHLLEKNQEINLHFQPVAMSGPSLFLCAFCKNNAGAPEPLVHPPANPCCHTRPTGTNLGFRVSTERYFDTVDSWSRDLNCRLFCSSGRATLVPQQFTTERRRETNSHPPSRGRPQEVASCSHVQVSVLWEDPDYLTVQNVHQA